MDMFSSPPGEYLSQITITFLVVRIVDGFRPLPGNTYLK